MKGVKFLRHAYYDRGNADNDKALSTVFKDKTTVLSKADIKEMSKAAQLVWEEEAAKSPEAARAVEILRKALAGFGRSQ